MDDFSQHPPSVSELKAERSRSSKDWTPRDVLISLLRRIDSGELSPDALLVMARDQDPEREDHHLSTWAVSSPDVHVTLGMIERCKFSILHGFFHD